MSKFKQQVIKAVCLVPFGKVASYGQIALMIGVPKAARQVGTTLNSLEEDVLQGMHMPWWRIVNNAGRISIKGCYVHTPLLQKNLLEKEGLVIDENLEFDIEKYRYRPSELELKGLELDENYIEMLLHKYLY